MFIKLFFQSPLAYKFFFHIYHGISLCMSYKYITKVLFQLEVIVTNAHFRGLPLVLIAISKMTSIKRKNKKNWGLSLGMTWISTQVCLSSYDKGGTVNIQLFQLSHFGN